MPDRPCNDDRIRVAILGGGCGSITAAYELSRTPELRQRYALTVYQMGWRLGGKGASGRDTRPGYGARILEHGLHVWAGFYDSAFRMMRDCYGTLDRPAGTPLSVWYDPERPADSAFLPQHGVTVEERHEGEWLHWVAELPETDGLPGDTEESLPNPWELMQTLVQASIGLVEGSIRWSRDDDDDDTSAGPIDWVMRLLSGKDGSHGRRLGEALATTIRRAEGAANADKPIAQQLRSSYEKATHNWLAPAILSLIHHAEDEVAAHGGPLGELVKYLHDFLMDQRRLSDGVSAAWRRVWLLTDLMLTHVRGMILDDVVSQGFEAINDIDWRAWMKKHGAREETLDSALVRGIYEYVFGFEEGREDRPSLEAGTAINGALRLVFSYKKAIFWTMQGAMGEVVFTPLYQLLKDRGVRFEFFHQVRSLELSEDKSTIDGITIGVQAELKSADRDYDPFFQVCGIDAWPSHPFYEQLVQGEELRDGQIDLESPFSGWADVGQRELRRGEDFDDVVLGISRGALDEICEELIEHRQSWRRMIAKVKTVQTQSLQLWLKPTRRELGWHAPETILTAYEPPWATWADLSFLGSKEDWAPGMVGSLAYFCGVMPTMTPDGDARDFVYQAEARVRDDARRWLDRHVGHLWPDATLPGSSGLDYSLLIDPENREGVARLDAQFVRANVNPSDAYVLSVPGSSAFRLAADESGFRNLFLAGDWVKTSINAGCVEAAVLSGVSAARALARTRTTRTPDRSVA